MAKDKPLKKLVSEYINDPRWKRVTALTKKTEFAKAARLSNQIIDSHPHHVRQAAESLKVR